MCRFLVYSGTQPIKLCHLVTRPVHSVINQTYESQLRFESPRPFNADGFGLGWYEIEGEDVAVDTDASGKTSDGALKSATPSDNPLSAIPEQDRPCIFKSLSPAWSSSNLTRLAEKIRSRLVFAHVRASTMPGAPSENNCHPWSYGRLMWMHNGEVGGWNQLRRRVENCLPEELYLHPEGFTDSEWTFMLFLSMLKDRHATSFTWKELKDALLATFAKLNELRREAGVEAPSLLNIVVSDGQTVVASRYVTSTRLDPSSLFFSSGTTFCESGEGNREYRMIKADKRESTIMIASEPLTFEQRDWMAVRPNTLLVVTPQINLLQIPILDEYHVAPKENARRTNEFAKAKGLGSLVEPM